MADFHDRAQVTQDAAFRGRVRIAAVLAALDVQGEVQGTMTTATWRKRRDLAENVLAILNDQDAVLEKLVWVVAAQITDPIAPTNDTEIIQIVGASWNDVAGVRAEDAA